MQLIIMIFDGKTQKVSEYLSLVILTWEIMLKIKAWHLYKDIFGMFIDVIVTIAHDTKSKLSLIHLDWLTSQNSNWINSVAHL